MRGTSYPSLVLAGDLIFAASENGRVAFIKPGREYQEVARSEVPGFKSTPIFVGDTLNLRTGEDIRAIQ